ncbi:MAG: hypothetical protein HQM08_18705 [Candidatus Riflebacteria bacterium]|nr:hypothetical protein [Candidatus Riflebacteria bacterium]
MLILIGNRKEAPVNVQKVLTGWSSIIKTRLDIHDAPLENCSDNGLLILELVGDPEKHDELMRKISLIQGVNAKVMNLSLQDEEI